MHHPTDRITHTTAFVTPVVEHWLIPPGQGLGYGDKEQENLKAGEAVRLGNNKPMGQWDKK